MIIYYTVIKIRKRRHSTMITDVKKENMKVYIILNNAT